MTVKDQSQVSAMQPSTPTPVLKQQLGPFQFFAIAFGSIIGVGWMIVVGDWLQSAGPLGVSLAFLGSAGMIVLVGLCYAELATILPVAGGEIAYTYLTSGPFLAYGSQAYRTSISEQECRAVLLQGRLDHLA